MTNGTVLRVVVCRRLKWTVGLSGSQTQACGPSIKQNRHQSSAIDVHQIMFHQLGSECSSMLLWRGNAAPPHHHPRGNAAPPHHHPPPIQSYRRYANRHCYGLGTGAPTHGRSTNKKAAGTDVRARTKASLNPPPLGTGGVSIRCADANPPFSLVLTFAFRSLRDPHTGVDVRIQEIPLRRMWLSRAEPSRADRTGNIFHRSPLQQT